MLLDLEVQKEGEWFPYMESDVDPNTGETVWGEPMEKVAVQIRSMKKFFEDSYASRKRVVEWKVHPKSKQNERHSYPKDLAPKEIIEERNDAYEYAITGLRGWKDKKTSKEIECSREVKLFLMSMGAFDRFFSNCQTSLETYGMIKEEKESKNLSIGSSSQTTKPDPG